MTLIDLVSIAFALVTIGVVVHAGGQIKTLLTEARYERLEINRRLEKLARRLDRIDGGGINGDGDPTRMP